MDDNAVDSERVPNEGALDDLISKVMASIVSISSTLEMVEDIKSKEEQTKIDMVRNKIEVLKDSFTKLQKDNDMESKLKLLDEIKSVYTMLNVNNASTL